MSEMFPRGPLQVRRWRCRLKNNSEVMTEVGWVSPKNRKKLGHISEYGCGSRHWVIFGTVSSGNMQHLWSGGEERTSEQCQSGHSFPTHWQNAAKLCTLQYPTHSPSSTWHRELVTWEQGSFAGFIPLPTSCWVWSSCELLSLASKCYWIPCRRA